MKNNEASILHEKEARIQVMSEIMVLGKVSMMTKDAACKHDELPRIEEHKGRQRVRHGTRTHTCSLIWHCLMIPQIASMAICVLLPICAPISPGKHALTLRVVEPVVYLCMHTCRLIVRS
jgi:hypothetical protein